MTAPDRRRRRRRGILPRLLALLVACLGLTLLVQPAGAAPAPGPAPPTVDASAGGSLYLRYCGLCHNNDGSGIPGTGAAAGPDLRGLPVAYVDLTIRTGRMPIVHREAGAVEERLSADERVAVVAWMTDEFELAGEIPEVLEGDAGRGQSLWLTNCAACHSASGQGGVSADGTLAPDVTGIDATGIVEATRVGPFEMPRFGEETLDEQQVADIAAYVQELGDADPTPLGLTDIGRVYAGALTGVLMLLVVGALVLVVRTGREAAVPPTGPAPREDGGTTGDGT